MNIFVGNLSFEAKESDVGKAFASFGKVDSVAIVMDKNGKKSRGFGFVEMPDEREALAAIATLQGKEILGRPVNVMASFSKKKKSEPKDSFPFKRTGKYKEGRRTLSYMKRRKDTGITVPIVERKFKANPMRWRKKSRWATPYRKPEAGPKPLIKSESSQSKPWKKAEGQPRPWRKSSASLQKLRPRRGGSFLKHKK